MEDFWNNMSKIVSIEIGYLLTKICEADFRSKSIKVYKSATFPTPEGSIEDGAIIDEQALADAIKAALSANQIKTRQVVFTIMSGKIATREVMLPDIKLNQVDMMVKTNAGDYFPIDLAQYQVTELVLGRETDAEGVNKLRTIVMAANKTLLDGYESLAKAVGLRLLAVDYAGNSVYQVMKNQSKEETEMVLKIEERSCLATIISNSTLVLQRNIVYGFDEALSEMMKYDVFGVDNMQDAFARMTGKSCIRSSFNADIGAYEEDEDDVDEEYNRARGEITEALKTLVGNISRFLDLYNSKHQDTPVKRVTLVGLGAKISGISKLLTHELGVKTVVVDSSIIANVAHVPQEVGLTGFITPIGATINPVGFVNEENKKNDIKAVNYNRTSVLIGVLTLVLVATMVVMSYLPYTEAKGKNERLIRQENSYLSDEEVFREYTNLKVLYADILAGYEQTKSPNDNLLDFLAELEGALPSSTLVTDIESDNEQVSLTMKVGNLEEAAAVVQKIRSFDSVMDIHLGSVSEETSDEDIKDAVAEAVEQAVRENDESGRPEEEARLYDELVNKELDRTQAETPPVIFNLICTYYPANANATAEASGR